MKRIHNLLNWGDTWLIDTNKYQVFQLILNEIDIGQIAVELPKDIAYICCLAVNPEYRKQGIGSHLLQIAEQYARSHNYTETRLIVQQSFENILIPFYEKRGYTKSYFDEQNEEWIMSKSLCPLS